MLIFGLNSYLYTGIISITEMGIQLWSLDHADLLDSRVRASRSARRGRPRCYGTQCPWDLGTWEIGVSEAQPGEFPISVLLPSGVRQWSEAVAKTFFLCYCPFSVLLVGRLLAR